MDWFKDEVQREFNLKTFPNLEDALVYLNLSNSKRAKKGQARLSVFSREIAVQGARYFFLENPKVFYDYYVTMRKKFKTIYEVLLKGKPCRLFFDIEFSKVLNKGIAGETRMRVFRQFLLEFLQQSLIKLEKGDVTNSSNYGISTVELDSSNEVKFSRHLIVSLGCYAFSDIDHVGFLVWSLCRKIREKITTGESSLNCLLINKAKKEEKQLLIDTSVYTMSRNFRLVMSAKVKDVGRRHLRVYCVETETCVHDKLLTKETFLSSLASFPKEEETQNIIDFALLQPEAWNHYNNRNHRGKPRNTSSAPMAIDFVKKRLKLTKKSLKSSEVNQDKNQSPRALSNLIE